MSLVLLLSTSAHHCVRVFRFVSTDEGLSLKEDPAVERLQMLETGSVNLQSWMEECGVMMRGRSSTVFQLLLCLLVNFDVVLPLVLSTSKMELDLSLPGTDCHSHE